MDTLLPVDIEVIDSSFRRHPGYTRHIDPPTGPRGRARPSGLSFLGQQPIDVNSGGIDVRRFVHQTDGAPAGAQPPSFGQFAAQRFDLCPYTQLLQFGYVGIIYTDGDGKFSPCQPIGKLTIVARECEILFEQGADKFFAQLPRPQSDATVAGAINPRIVDGDLALPFRIQ